MFLLLAINIKEENELVYNIFFNIPSILIIRIYSIIEDLEKVLLFNSLKQVVWL